MGMRPHTERLSAVGFSPWIPLNWRSSSFGIGLGVKLSSGASLTCAVQHTFDELQPPVKDFSGSRTTTVATITRVNHGLSVGDSAIIQNAAAPFSGAFAVASVVDADNFTYTVANSGATAFGRGAALGIFSRIFEHDTLTALVASADGNYAFPPIACRLSVSVYASGFVDLTVISGGE